MFHVEVFFNNRERMDFEQAQKILQAFNRMPKDKAAEILEDVYFGNVSLNQKYGLSLFSVTPEEVKYLVVSSDADKVFSLSKIDFVTVNGIQFTYEKVREAAKMLINMSGQELANMDVSTYGMLVSWLFTLQVVGVKFNPFE